MNRYNITPEVTTGENRVSVSLLIGEHPAGAWMKHEEAAQEIDDLIKQIAALDGELEQAWRERDGYKKALEAATQSGTDRPPEASPRGILMAQYAGKKNILTSDAREQLAAWAGRSERGIGR